MASENYDVAVASWYVSPLGFGAADRTADTQRMRYILWAAGKEPSAAKHGE